MSAYERGPSIWLELALLAIGTILIIIGTLMLARAPMAEGGHAPIVLAEDVADVAV